MGTLCAVQYACFGHCVYRDRYIIGAITTRHRGKRQFVWTSDDYKHPVLPTQPAKLSAELCNNNNVLPPYDYEIESRCATEQSTDTGIDTDAPTEIFFAHSPLGGETSIS